MGNTAMRAQIFDPRKLHFLPTNPLPQNTKPQKRRKARSADFPATTNVENAPNPALLASLGPQVQAVPIHGLAKASLAAEQAPIRLRVVGHPPPADARLTVPLPTATRRALDQEQSQ